MQLEHQTEITQAIAGQCAFDAARLRGLLSGPVRRHRVLADAPEFPFLFEPFMQPLTPGQQDEFVLVPRTPDAPPLSPMIAGLTGQY